MLSGSGKKVVSFGSLAGSAMPKISGGGLANYSSTHRSEGFKFGSSRWGSEFKTFTNIKTENVIGE